MALQQSCFESCLTVGEHRLSIGCHMPPLYSPSSRWKKVFTKMPHNQATWKFSGLRFSYLYPRVTQLKYACPSIYPFVFYPSLAWWWRRCLWPPCPCVRLPIHAQMSHCSFLAYAYFAVVPIPRLSMQVVVSSNISILRYLCTDLNVPSNFFADRVDAHEKPHVRSSSKLVSNMIIQ